MISVLTLPVIPLLLSVPLTWNNWGETQRMPKIRMQKRNLRVGSNISSKKSNDYVSDQRFEFDDFSAISDVDLYLRLADGKLIKEKGVARNGGISVEIKVIPSSLKRYCKHQRPIQGDILCLSDKFDEITEVFFEISSVTKLLRNPEIYS